MAKEVTISTFTDYLNRIFKLSPREHDYGLYPEELVFRGLSNKNYSLVPSIGRRPSEHWLNTFLTVESTLVSEAKQKFPSIFSDEDLPMARLAKLQHFGIPTRMLDVTSSALVALYFACQHFDDKNQSDGQVIVFSQIALPASNCFANIIADTYRLTGNAMTDIEKLYYRAVKQEYCISNQYPDWEKSIDKRIDGFVKLISKPLLVESFESSTRQKNQQGKYILFPNRIITDEEKNQYIYDDLVELDKDDPMIIKRINIPKDLKQDILKKLRLLGISEEFLFADSIDTVFKGVKKRQAERYKTIP